MLDLFIFKYNKVREVIFLCVHTYFIIYLLSVNSNTESSIFNILHNYSC